MQVVQHRLGASLDLLLDRRVAVLAALGVEAHQILEAGAAFQHLARDAQQLGELTVVDDQLQVAVEQADAGGNVLDDGVHQAGLALRLLLRGRRRLLRRVEGCEEDRKGVVWGKRGSVRVELGGRRIITKKKKHKK